MENLVFEREDGVTLLFQGQNGVENLAFQGQNGVENIAFQGQTLWKTLL